MKKLEALKKMNARLDKMNSELKKDYEYQIKQLDDETPKRKTVMKYKVYESHDVNKLLFDIAYSDKGIKLINHDINDNNQYECTVYLENEEIINKLIINATPDILIETYELIRIVFKSGIKREIKEEIIIGVKLEKKRIKINKG